MSIWYNAERVGPPVSRLACGLDFGTSNSTLGVPGPAGPRLIALEAGQATVPSAFSAVRRPGRPF